MNCRKNTFVDWETDANKDLKDKIKLDNLLGCLAG